jgi:hypothetical protein
MRKIEISENEPSKNKITFRSDGSLTIKHRKGSDRIERDNFYLNVKKLSNEIEDTHVSLRCNFTLGDSKIVLKSRDKKTVRVINL